MYITDLPIVIAKSLFFTIVIEIFIAMILRYRQKDLLNVLLVNILTNPLVNSITVSINYYLGLQYRQISLIILEIIAIFIEGMIYQKYLNNWKINWYLLSIILNISSFSLGLLINKMIY